MDIKLHQVTNIKSFFEDQLKDIAKKQGTLVSPFASEYLSSLMMRFMESRNFFSSAKINQLNQTIEEKFEMPTLALLWLESLEKNQGEQYFALQQLGDLALFTSGYFADRLSGSIVDRDYYAAMGERAYEKAGHIRETISSEKSLNIFFELAENFRKYKLLLEEFSEQTSIATDQKHLLKVYEKWLSERSHHLARILAEHGIIPQAPGHKKLPD